MLLIVIGVWSILKRHYAGGTILIAIGIFFIYPVLCRTFPESFISFDVDIKTYWPLLLIVLGLILILSRFYSPCKRRRKEAKAYKSEYYAYSEKTKQSYKERDADFVDKNVMFGSTEQIVLSQNLRGGEANVMFGELIVDLRHAKLAEKSTFFEANVMFGSVVIYVPTDWNIELQGSSLLGSFEDKRYHANRVQDNTKPLLVIKGSAMFGSGEIRN